MRAALYQFLTENCQSIKTWMQPYAPDNNTPPPYGVILLGDEIQSPNNSRGFFNALQIWPYFKPGSYIPVDNAVTELRKLLDGRVFTTASGMKFELEYIRTGRDYKDPDLNALTRKMDFRIPIVR